MEKFLLFKYTKFCTFCCFLFNLQLSTWKLVTATELGGPMHKPLGNSELGSLVCNKLLLGLKSWCLISLRFALDLVLNTSFHLYGNEPYLRRKQDGRVPLLPGAYCQPGSNLAEAGKGERLSVRAKCPQPPASACLPHLGEPAHIIWTENSHTVFIITMFAAVHLGTGSLKSCHPPRCCALSWWRKSKGAESFHERQCKGLTLCFNLLLSQVCWESGVSFCRCVDLGGECSAGFLFEM